MTTAAGFNGGPGSGVPDPSKSAMNDTLKRKRKKERRTLPAPQILCQALSNIFRRDVLVESNSEAAKNAGTWGGEGWTKRPSSYSSTAPIMLRLYLHKPVSMEDDWSALASIFPKLLNKEFRRQVFPNQNVKQAASFHSRANALSRNGFALFKTDDEAFDDLKSCLDTLSSWLAKQVVLWISPEVKEASKDIAIATEELGDLFRDEYGGGGLYGDTIMDVDKGPMATLFLLLQDAANGITAGFLEDVFRTYDQGATDDDQLARIFLSFALKQLASSKQAGSFSSATLTHQVNALSNLLSAPRTQKALSSAMQGELTRMKDMNGSEVQAIVQLAPLFEAVAYAIPPAGAELPRRPHLRQQENYPFLKQLEQSQGFPLSVFQVRRGVNDIGRIMEEARTSMKTAENVAEECLRIAFKRGGKEQTFQWLTNLIRSNESTVKLLKLDLLETDGLVALSSTRDFLLGVTWTLVGFCHSNLSDRLKKKGAGVINIAYLGKALQETCQEPVTDKNRLFQHSVQSPSAEPTGTEMEGATRFFFLSSLLLHVALHPVLRMEEEFDYRYRKAIDKVENAALANEGPSPNAFKDSSPLIAAWLGWRTYLYNPGFASCVTNFCLLQLRWLTELALGGKDLSQVPDWLCREPARWLSHLARLSPRSLTPAQADKAVEYTTTLLDLAASDSGFVFSPVSVTSLIDVVASFVRAGVSRARRKEKHRGKKRGDEVGDDRDLDVYSSFDRNDLGVTVFTHHLVKQKLCPTLLRTFLSVDAAEGVDADLDASFSKLSAKSQIAELLNRLWCHPSGDCRESVVSLPASEILGFVSSVSSVARVNLNFGTEAIEKHHATKSENSLSQAAGALLGMRSLLALLCALSQDDRVAAYLGGYSSKSSECEQFLTSLANMVIQVLETLTSCDGGTNQSLEDKDMQPTASTLGRLEELSPTEQKRAVEDVIAQRIRAKRTFGLDVSVTCHQLLALAAKWHFEAAKKGTTTGSRSSLFLSLLAENDDCDTARMMNVFLRLVVVPVGVEGSEVDNASMILLHDGYVDHTPWMHKYEANEDSESSKRARFTAGQDQMKHLDIARIASNEDIEAFLVDLDRKVSDVRGEQAKETSPAGIELAQSSIFSRVATLNEDTFTSFLSPEWVVSSSPFRSRIDETRLLHKYDKTARNRGLQADAKLLVKEARKCRKMMPLPSPTAAIYVCFAEERMDLCRVVMTGPESTPYAHGLFQFDVFFPPTYPQIPPLVTFMTTGGGRVRFNPNLYVDGKVCISLLGVTTASDVSERWNPELSSLSQLMITVQSQILGVQEPYFNEGNGVPQSARRTSAGRKGSAKYNNTVRLETLRCAMVEQLRSPPQGFEEVTIRHFAMCRQRVVVQARRWMLEARDTALFPRYERTYSELLPLLSTEAMNSYECLAPLPEDMEVLERLEPSFLRMIESVAFNPWDGTNQFVPMADEAQADLESDDEMYT